MMNKHTDNKNSNLEMSISEQELKSFLDNYVTIHSPGFSAHIVDVCVNKIIADKEKGLDSSEGVKKQMQCMVSESLKSNLPDSVLTDLFNDGKPQNYFNAEVLPSSLSLFPFYALTNEEKICGASMMARPDVLEKIDKLMPEGFYILPSSRHEVLIISKDMGHDAKALGQMVREVNKNELEKEDYLSDRVYEYDRGSRSIKEVPESLPKELGMER